MIRTTLKIALAQLNPIVGDVDGNEARAREARKEAAGLGADLVMFPELFLSGYPCEDLVLNPAFQDACRAACDRLARETADGGPGILVGLPWKDGEHLHNACALLDEGRIAAIRYQVAFSDEGNEGNSAGTRVFAPGPLPGPVNFRGVRLGLPIGADLRSEDVVECLTETGAELLLVPCGSAYRRGRSDRRLNDALLRVTESGLPLVHLNQVGGQDEAVFDGASFVLNADSSLAGQLPAFHEAMALTQWQRRADFWTCIAAPLEIVEEGDEADYAACVLGLRDFVTKNRFRGIVLGLSGGIGSALCAVMAVDAVGPEHVRAVTLPSRHTTERSLEDAASCVATLGMRYDVLPIAAAVEELEAILHPLLADGPRNRLQANFEAGSRGTILKTLAGSIGAMVVATADKSELALGDAPGHGGTLGGFAPLKDLYKTEVFRLADLRNRWRPAGALGPAGPVIPAAILDKGPDSEPRDDRTDGEALPPRAELDAILRALSEDGMRVAEIAARGHGSDVVKRIAALVTLTESGRRVSAPGVRLTSGVFGRDRRLPIVNRFRDSGKPAFRPDVAVEGDIGRPRVTHSDL